MRVLPGRTVRNLLNTIPTRKKPRYVVKKKYSTKPRYYAQDWCDYKWVGSPDEAFVFSSMEMVELELRSTMVLREAWVEVVTI